MRITADRNVCIGSGHCVLAAPVVFDQDDDEGLVTVVRPDPGEAGLAAARLAAQSCPSGAISVSEA
ncbi:MAG: ferredoxin [Trebonia sp.]